MLKYFLTSYKDTDGFNYSSGIVFAKNRNEANNIISKIHNTLSEIGIVIGAIKIDGIFTNEVAISDAIDRDDDDMYSRNALVCSVVLYCQLDSIMDNSIYSNMDDVLYFILSCFEYYELYELCNYVSLNRISRYGNTNG